jgi:AraC-like DNA-binding protein
MANGGINKTLYQDDDKNAVRFSVIQKIEAEVPFTGLGVKYVAAGEEVYYANNKKYRVKKGEYIIGNNFTSALVTIDDEKPVQGLCIDISSQIIAEVADFHDLSDSDLKNFLLSDQFFVNRYNAKNTSLGYSLNEINRQIVSGEFLNEAAPNELFYSLAESIITDQRFVFDHLHKMDFKKMITNEEVFRILLDAKAFIDDNLLHNLSLYEITLHAGLSKYHFIRVFKSVFGVSPYQYQKRQQLEYARREIQNGKPISDIAYTLGYADVPTFSKAFKQAFGLPPAQYKK